MLGELVPIVFFTFLSDSPPPTPTSNFVCIVLYIWHVAPTCLCPKAVHTPLCSIVNDFYTLRNYLFLLCFFLSFFLPLATFPSATTTTTHFPIAHICVFLLLHSPFPIVLFPCSIPLPTLGTCTPLFTCCLLDTFVPMVLWYKIWVDPIVSLFEY